MAGPSMNTFFKSFNLFLLCHTDFSFSVTDICYRIQLLQYLQLYPQTADAVQFRGRFPSERLPAEGGGGFSSSF